MLAANPATPIRRNLNSALPSPRTPDSVVRPRGAAARRNIVATNDNGDKRKRRQSLMEDGRRRRQSLLFSPAVGLNGQRLTAEEQQRSFDEWMKIAADNKINATNSWNLALIDYFYDMTLLREGDSINFQKASCTLDGCVKIYTSRVDSVDSETKRLLSGLADSDARDGRDEDAEHGLDDDEDVDALEQRPKKRSARATNTLEKDASVLNLKKFDQEFMVDPLFKKTSADFDEGGAHGLLLNHLSISREIKIIFDASDVTTTSGMEEEQEEKEGTDEMEVEERVDINRLKAMFLPSLTKIWEQDVCPSLKTFTFSNTSIPFEFGRSDSSSTLFDSQETGFGTYDEAAYDEFGGNDDDDDEFGGGGMGMDMDIGDAADGPGAGAGYSFADVGSHNPLPDGDFMLATTNEEENMFSYFDTTMLKNWAGPEHWRARALKNQKLPSTPSKRAPKPRDTINFLDPLDVDIKALFAPAKNSIQMPKMTERTKSTHLLPDDQHFSSKDLLRLFLKPACKIKFRRKDGLPAVDTLQDGHVDEEFFASHENAGVEGNPNGPIMVQEPVDGGFADYDSDSEADDDLGDMPGMGVSAFAEDGTTRTGEEMDYGDQLVAEPLKVKAVPLRYARVAKKVDVKRLKENIWRKLVDDGNGPQEPLPLQTPSRLPPPPPPDSHVPGTKTFTTLVKSMDTMYTEKKRKDISVAFCFICLLHLANEQGLKIEGDQEQLSELYVSQPGVEVN